MKLAALLLLALPIWSQISPPVNVCNGPVVDDVCQVPTGATLTLPAPTNLPKFLVTAGGGYASPGGSFAYTSASTLVLPQQTYLTVAQEYALVKGTVESCTFGGVTKPIYQFSVVTAGLTGLGGGCNSTKGSTSPAGSGQVFVHFNWGHLPLGSVFTLMKNTDSGWKATIGFTWRQ